jgi:hypothetical protein
MQYLRWKPHYVQEWIKILWIKITHYVQEEPLCCYIASSNACIYASENLCHDETKLPIKQFDHFNPSLEHESTTNFIPSKNMVS